MTGLNRRHARFVFYVGPVVLWLGVIYLSSTKLGASENTLRFLGRLIELLQPEGDAVSPESMGRLNFVVRKVAHITEYAILTLLLVRALQYGRQALRPGVLLMASALSLLYAVSDEIHQQFVSGRSATAKDVALDAFGALLVLVGLFLWAIHRKLELFLWEG
jgi:VanZ family protein